MTVLKQQMEEQRAAHARRLRSLEAQLAQALGASKRRAAGGSGTPAAAAPRSAAAGGSPAGSWSGNGDVEAARDTGSSRAAGSDSSPRKQGGIAAINSGQLRAKSQQVVAMQAALRERDQQVGGRGAAEGGQQAVQWAGQGNQRQALAVQNVSNCI